MKKNKPTDQQPAAGNAALKIGSLRQLQALVDAPLQCEFSIDGRAVTLPLKRVTAKLEDQRRALLRGVQPPWKEIRKDYDLLDEKYLVAKEAAEKKARSLVVYACCPAVAAEKPGLTAVDDIHAFVQELLSEQILDIIALTALSNGVSLEVQSRANFTSTPGLGD